MRWVQTAFLAIGALLFWMLDKLVVIVWEKFAEPNSAVATAVSGLLAGVIAWRLYEYEKLNRLAHEVAGEMAKVTWPTRQEISVSTIVVVITSIIAAAIMGSFDAIWSAVTDLIYRV